MCTDLLDIGVEMTRVCTFVTMEGNAGPFIV